VAERKRTADEEWITRLGGGDFERGLEIGERHRREAEEHRRKRAAEAQRQREIAGAEEKLRERDRRLARAIRRGESVVDL
jgi:hypothetical protein